MCLFVLLFCFVFFYFFVVDFFYLFDFLFIIIIFSGSGKFIDIVILILPVSGHQARKLHVVYCFTIFAGICCIPNALKVPTGSESGNGLHNHWSDQQHLPGGLLCSVGCCTEAGSCVSEGEGV